MSIAVDFLQQLRPGGPWVLTAITPDGPTNTITAHTGDQVDAFVSANDGKRNIYYSVNPTRTAMSKKAAKTDIAAIDFMLADLDPADGETAEDAKTRYLSQLDGAFAPKPTAAVDSGNGIQAVWRLEHRITLGDPIKDEQGKLVFSPEDQRTIADVEARAAVIMVLLGAKPGTQNIDRILRLPGTINLPNKKKQAAGRVACPATLLHFNGAAYPLAAFPLPDPKPKDPPQGGHDDIPPRLASLLSVTGRGGYPSRSELLFAFLTEALRLKVAEAAIVRACLEAREDCGIYEHCRENGGRGYVERQIKKARKKIGEPKPEMMSDLGNARRLVRLHGTNIRYVCAWGKWIVWVDGQWRKDEDGAVMRMAKSTVEEMFAEAARINDEDRRDAMRKFALKSQSAERLAAMVKLATSESEVVLAVEKLDADPMLLGVKNGVIDLRTGDFRQARQEDYITKRAGTAFDAGAACPNWITFLDKIFMNDAKLIAYVQRYCGYILTGRTGEEVLCVLWGQGSNGKSTLREVLFALLGEYAVASDASLLVTAKKTGATPELARLIGCRLVTINETQQGDHLNEARVKFITGHDTMSARNLYEGPVDFTPTHKSVLTTNHKPIVRGTDKGIWRRIHLWPFLYTFPEEKKDVNFREEKLLPELPGILNWALEGLKAYRREGLKPPNTVQAATDEYREDMDIVGQWIDERCVRDEKAKEATSVLHSDYKTWAVGEVGFSGEVGYAVSPRTFGRELIARGFKPTKLDGNSKRGVIGLRFKGSAKDEWLRLHAGLVLPDDAADQLPEGTGAGISDKPEHNRWPAYG
jgi:P4 family phage/plasmid primase-like protien